MKPTYKEAITYTYPNATVRVSSPSLSEGERAARLKQIYAAAADVLKDFSKR